MEDLEINYSALGLQSLTMDEMNIIPSLTGEFSLSLSPVLRNELSFNVDESIGVVRSRTTNELTDQSLNPNQLQIFNLINASLINKIGGLFFIQARGGTGKTFLLNTLLAAARTVNAPDRTPALAVASSGIAATLLSGGRTAHSRFKVPINVDQTTTLPISLQSHLAELIKRSQLIVWDEAPMAQKNIFEAVDRCLRDIQKKDAPFGGKTVVLVGDFRLSKLPVIM